MNPNPWNLTRLRRASTLLLSAVILMSCSLTTALPPAATEPASIESRPTGAAEPPKAADPSATIPAAAVAPSATTAPSQTPEPTAQPTPVEAYTGLIAFADQRLTAYTFDGLPSGFQVALPGVEYVSSWTTSVYNAGVAVPQQDGSVDLLTAGGTQTVGFIQSDQPVSVAISADGTRIAWDYQFWSETTFSPATQVWIASIDGSNAQKIAEITAEANKDSFLVYHVVSWLPDGQLLFATQLSGIGGYILYGNWNSLHLYNPATGKVTDLVDPAERLGLSLNSVSHDLQRVAISADGIRIRRLSTRVEVQLPAQADQNVCGSAQFSPSDTWVAYGCGRNDPENEAGQVMFAATDGSTVPVTLYNQTGGAPQVLGWIDEDSLLFSTYANDSGVASIWRVDTDGTHLLKLLDGSFVGLIPNP